MQDETNDCLQFFARWVEARPIFPARAVMGAPPFPLKTKALFLLYMTVAFNLALYTTVPLAAMWVGKRDSADSKQQRRVFAGAYIGMGTLAAIAMAWLISALMRGMRVARHLLWTVLASYLLFVVNLGALFSLVEKYNKFHMYRDTRAPMALPNPHIIAVVAVYGTILGLVVAYAMTWMLGWRGPEEEMDSFAAALHDVFGSAFLARRGVEELDMPKLEDAMRKCVGTVPGIDIAAFQSAYKGTFVGDRARVPLSQAYLLMRDLLERACGGNDACMKALPEALGCVVHELLGAIKEAEPATPASEQPAVPSSALPPAQPRKKPPAPVQADEPPQPVAPAPLLTSLRLPSRNVHHNWGGLEKLGPTDLLPLSRIPEYIAAKTTKSAGYRLDATRLLPAFMHVILNTRWLLLTAGDKMVHLLAPLVREGATVPDDVPSDDFKKWAVNLNIINCNNDALVTGFPDVDAASTGFVAQFSTPIQCSYALTFKREYYVANQVEFGVTGYILKRKDTGEFFTLVLDIPPVPSMRTKPDEYLYDYYSHSSCTKNLSQDDLNGHVGDPNNELHYVVLQKYGGIIPAQEMQQQAPLSSTVLHPSPATEPKPEPTIDPHKIYLTAYNEGTKAAAEVRLERDPLLIDPFLFAFLQILNVCEDLVKSCEGKQPVWNMLLALHKANTIPFPTVNAQLKTDNLDELIAALGVEIPIVDCTSCNEAQFLSTHMRKLISMTDSFILRITSTEQHNDLEQHNNDLELRKYRGPTHYYEPVGYMLHDASGFSAIVSSRERSHVTTKARTAVPFNKAQDILRSNTVHFILFTKGSAVPNRVQFAVED